jgi:hypothetical protein
VAGGRLAKHRQSHGHQRAFAHFALYFDGAAVQFDAAFHNHQTQSSAGALAHVTTSMERIEQPGQVAFRNADSVIANAADGIALVSFYNKLHHSPGL